GFQGPRRILLGWRQGRHVGIGEASRHSSEQGVVLLRFVVVLTAGNRVLERRVVKAADRLAKRRPPLERRYPEGRIEQTHLFFSLEAAEEPVVDIGPVVQGRNEDLGPSFGDLALQTLETPEGLRSRSAVGIALGHESFEPPVQDRYDRLITSTDDDRDLEAGIQKAAEERLP